MSQFNLPDEAIERQEPEAAAADAEATGGRCACTLYAVVNADGTLARGFGAVSSTAFGGGSYEVVFNRDLTRSAFTASIGLSGSVGASAPGEITVVGRFGNPKGVFITTHDSAGGFAERGFHLAVHSRP